MKEQLKDKILQIIPTNKMDAIPKETIAEQLEVGPCTIQAELRLMRASGIPILWNVKGIFIDYNIGAIQKQNRIIQNMKTGYFNGMTKIQDYFKTIIDSENAKNDIQNMRY